MHSLQSKQKEASFSSHQWPALPIKLYLSLANSNWPYPIDIFLKRSISGIGISLGHGRQDLHCSHFEDFNFSFAKCSIFFNALISEDVSFWLEFTSFFAILKSSNFVAPKDRVVIPFDSKNL